ncbi:MAG: hypothetical protein AAB692_02575, partial [Patescibacteria group bacterium]
MNSVDCVGVNDCWAVGQFGTIIRWAGSSWTTAVTPTAKDLNVISMIAAGNAFAGGKGGAIVRLSGGTWSNYSSPTNREIKSMKMLSTSDAHVGGSNGLFLRWNGTVWSLQASPTNDHIFGMDFLNASTGWAAAATGRIYLWNGTAWAVDPTFISSPNNIRSVSAVAAADVWVCGDAGTIAHYTGAYLLNGTFTSAVVDSGSAGTVWNLTAWTETLPGGTDLTIATRTGNVAVPDGTWSAYGAELTDPTGSPLTSPAGRYIQYRFTFTTPSQLTTPVLSDITLLYGQPTGQDLHGVDGVAPSDVWAVGNGGAILHWNGTS